MAQNCLIYMSDNVKMFTGLRALVVLCYAVLTRPKQVHVEIAVFRGWALAFSFFRFTAFSDFLNFIFEELERFEHSTSLLQHPGVLTSSALPGVLHCNSLSRDHLAPVW